MVVNRFGKVIPLPSLQRRHKAPLRERNGESAGTLSGRTLERYSFSRAISFLIAAALCMT